MRSVKPNLWILLVYIALAAFVWIVVGRVVEPDANYVLYRFVSNLREGHGLVYLTPESTVTAYPLGPILMLPLVLLGLTLQIAGGLITIISAAVGGYFLGRLLHNHWIAGAAYLLLTVVQPAPTVLLMLALVLAAFDSAANQRWVLAGILMGVAILTEPTALIPMLLGIVLVLRSRASNWKYITPVLLVVLPWLILLVLTKTSITTEVVSIVPGVVSMILPIFAVIALIRYGGTLREEPAIAILFIWSEVTALLALLRGTLPTAAIVPGLIAVVTLIPQRPLLLIAAAADLVLSIALAEQFAVSPASESIGRWLAANTGSDTRVATTEIGAQSFYAGRPVIDLSGKLQPIAFDRFFILRDVPDVVILKNNMTVPWEPFATTYARMLDEGDETVYQRVVNFSPLDDHGVDVNFGANLGRSDLHLSNVGLGNTVHPGDLVRVKLDWQLAYRPSFDTAIKLTLLNAQGIPVQGIRDIIRPDEWQTGPISTYHVIPLPNEVPTGPLLLYLGVEIRAGSLGELKVAETNVTVTQAP